MAFYDKTEDLPHPDAMDLRSSDRVGIVAGTIFLLIAGVAFALFLFFVIASAPNQRTVNPPSTTELAPAPSAQPAPRPASTP